MAKKAKAKATSKPAARNVGDPILEIGKAYLIRTVTHYYTGRLVAITAGELLLEDAAWIADTGRYSDSLLSGELNEIEPYPGEVVVFRGACVDASEWNHALPRTRK